MHCSVVYSRRRSSPVLLYSTFSSRCSFAIRLFRGLGEKEDRQSSVPCSISSTSHSIFPTSCLLLPVEVFSSSTIHSHHSIKRATQLQNVFYLNDDKKYHSWKKGKESAVTATLLAAAALSSGSPASWIAFLPRRYHYFMWMWRSRATRRQRHTISIPAVRLLRRFDGGREGIRNCNGIPHEREDLEPSRLQCNRRAVVRNH